MILKKLLPLKFLLAHKEKLLYAYWGILTTLVNYAIYIACVSFIALHYLEATAVSWFGAVIFAYLGNKFFVFVSLHNDLKTIAKEFSLFFSARFFSGVLEVLLMYIFVDFFLVNDKIMKLLVGFIVVIANYLFSKFFIFATF